MDSSFNYPTDLVISYSNNSDYRAAVRQLFNMNPSNYNPASQVEGLDPESKDELEYDDSAIMLGMDWIYDKIKDNEIFQYLLSRAAAKYISEDHGIGLSVLMCYDYLDAFHGCLVSFLTDPDNFNETNTAYLNLLVKL
jgi:hypothetical protein